MKQKIKIDHPVVQKWFDLPESIRNDLTKKYYPERCLLTPSEMLTILEHEPQEETQKELFNDGTWIRLNENIISKTKNKSHLICTLTVQSQKGGWEANGELIAQAKNMYYELKEILQWVKVKDGKAEWKTSTEKIEELKQLLKKANPSL